MLGQRITGGRAPADITRFTSTSRPSVICLDEAPDFLEIIGGIPGIKQNPPRGCGCRHTSAHLNHNITGEPLASQRGSSDEHAQQRHQTKVLLHDAPLSQLRRMVCPSTQSQNERKNEVPYPRPGYGLQASVCSVQTRVVWIKTPNRSQCSNSRIDWYLRTTGI
ncbi:uncharacterized protein STAUR_0127 [Stigmatella aurantiaca DW4/3-1]|uniref:Uncharacterized protein n=1 Tax=Stigmatella aurantiaca (strain DW4/3-1) TaxID=378806 RepID=E3FKG3_STIAD|nr:uncharacterized protein STAUR_0127 [Stigmatella aurantiaca DW4/3-1]